MKKVLLSVLIFFTPIIFFAQTIYVMDGTPVTACNGLFTDSGGDMNFYMNDEDLTTTICPTNTETIIKLTFDAEPSIGPGDTLCFFDGNSVNAPLLTCLPQMNGLLFEVEGTATNTSGCITVSFKSDDVYPAMGWSANISCVAPCQAFDAQILSSTPPVIPVDTGYIDLCLGDSVFLSGTANFYQNNLLYTQDNSTSTFRWEMGDGNILEGENISYTYSNEGGYYVKLIITDVMGCTNDVFVQRIRVVGASDFIIENNQLAGTCEGDTVTLIANTNTADTIYFAGQLSNFIDTPIPDGTGVSVTSKLYVDQFPAGSVLTNISDLRGICINIEHSWMRDLEVKLTCPSGNSIILHNHAGNTGGEVFLGEPDETDEALPSPIPGIGYQYCFTDDAFNGTFLEYANNTGVGTLPTGEYSSFDDFSNLLGCSLNGEWEISIQDLWGIDNGYMFSWALNFDGDLLPATEFFTANITNQGWVSNPSVISILGDTLVAQIGATQDFTYQVDFANGCAIDTTIEITPFPNNTLACSDCDDLVIDAGADMAFDCISPQVILDATNSSNGDYFAYAWTTIDGQFLSATDQLVATVGTPGTYIFTLTSLLTDCILSDTVLVLPTQNTPIADAGEDFPFPCNVSEVILDGSNSTIGFDFTFQWSASGGQIISGGNTLSPIVSGAGIYLLEVTNIMNGCIDLDTIVVEEQVINDISIIDATCDSSDGMISVSIPSGTVNPIFSWSNGQSGSTIENLAQGWYSVSITYDNNCMVEENIFVDEELSCKVQIIGRVFNDNVSPDCLDDLTSVREEAIMLHLMPDDVYTYTNYNGFYKFVTDNGDHTVEVMLPSYLENLCPSDGLINVSLPTNGTTSADNDFYLKYVPGAFDLDVSCFMGVARPGMEHLYDIEYCNEGELAKSGMITFIHDSEETNIFTNPLPQDWNYDAATSTATWTFTDLQPGDCLTQQIILDIPTTAQIGDILSGSLEIISDDGDDFDLNNNFKSWNQTVSASYDPNDKQVFTASSEDQFGGMIYESDTTLFYQIRFQNTGTDTAFAVVIRDTLDEVLDVTTIRPSISSHLYSLEFEGNNILIFNFENILLPDSTTNLEESQGYVTFSIDRRLDLPLGTTISNSAAIYFDYNLPVITNEVVNILSEPVSVENIRNQKPSLEVSPNPSQGEFSIFYNLKNASEIWLTVFDIYGEIIFEIEKNKFQMSGNHMQRFSIKNLPGGIYFLQLKTENGSVVKKILKTE
ncbi:MAG: PKD domain-containing protein [Saprospiraceae bacterium]